jgi:quercetin dioxygenase-like cupin family protein
MSKFARRCLFVAGLASLGFGSLESPVRAESGKVVVKRPGEIAYSQAAGGMPQIAVLYGDPNKAEFFVARMKFPAGFKVEPHTHPEGIRTLTVLSGTLYFGFGPTFDETKVEAFPPGTFFTELPTTPHFVWAKDGEVVLQVSGIGPTGFTPSH